MGGSNEGLGPMDVPTSLRQRQGAWAVGRPEDACRRFHFERRLFLRKMVFERLDYIALGRRRLGLHQCGPFGLRLAGEIFGLFVAIAALEKTTDACRKNGAVFESSPFDLGLVDVLAIVDDVEVFVTIEALGRPFGAGGCSGGSCWVGHFHNGG